MSLEHTAHIFCAKRYRGRRSHTICALCCSLCVWVWLFVYVRASTCTRVDLRVRMCVDVHVRMCVERARAHVRRTCACAGVRVRRHGGIRKLREQMKNSKERAAIKRGETQNFTAV